jgi:thiol-disulfide isomerase/thioredoxin
MRQMLKDYGAVLLLALAVVLLFGRRGGAPDLPDLAPELSVPDLEGANVALADLRGAPVVLNFWASWCGPCRQEIPAFSAFAAEHPDVHVIGVAVDSGDRDAIEKAARSFGISYRVAVADRGVVSRYGIETLPTTVIIDADGKVKSAHVGTLSKASLVAALQ